MRASILLLAVLPACGNDPAPPSGPITATIEHYDYTFDLESRAAIARLTVQVTGEGDCLTLPLRADLDGEVLLDGVAATVTVADDTMTACGAGWHDGDELQLEAALTVPLETWGALQVGYSISNNANDRPFYYLVSWVGGCDRFAPCDHRPELFARYRFTVTHPAGVTVLCPGDVTPGATTTTCDFDHDGGPTYSTFGLVATDDWQVSERGTWGDLAVTLYSTTNNLIATRLDDAYEGAFVTWMEDHFGPYPYGDTLRIATGPTYWNGFEHAGNIVINDALGGGIGAAARIRDVVTHELAHMWAGDQTTLATTYDFAWKEAMAEYLSFLFEVEQGLGEGTPTSWKSASRGAAFHPVPEEHPELIEFWGETYGPGPMVLFRQLEALFSRDAVLEALTALLGREHAISVDDVRLALEDSTGADLVGYFDRWVFGTGAPTWPEFTVTLNDTGADVEVTVTQLAPEDGLYGCAFAVELHGATTDERAEVWIDLGVDGTAQVTEVAVAPGFDPVTAVLDPRATCLAYAPSAAPVPRHPPGWSPWIAESQGR